MGCWRIRRSPDRPKPCSCSDMGDMAVESKSKADPTSIEGRCLILSALFPVIPIRFPVLRFLGIVIMSGGFCAIRWKIDCCKSERARRETELAVVIDFKKVLFTCTFIAPIYISHGFNRKPSGKNAKSWPLWPRLELLAAFNSNPCRGQRVWILGIA